MKPIGKTILSTFGLRGACNFVTLRSSDHSRCRAGRMHSDIARATLVSLCGRRIALVLLWRGADADVARATLSSLCAPWTALFVVPCSFWLISKDPGKEISGVLRKVIDQGLVEVLGRKSCEPPWSSP